MKCESELVWQSLCIEWKGKKIPKIISGEPTGVPVWEHRIMLCSKRSIMFDRWEEKESKKSLLESEREKEKDSILELVILSA